MKIAFVSPVKGQCGNTTVSLLTAAFMATKYERKTCFMQIGDDKLDSVSTYLGLQDNYADPTRSLSQVQALLEHEAINNDDLKNYAIPVSPHLDFFHLSSKVTGREKLVNHIVQNAPYEYTFLDICSSVGVPSVKSALAAVDLIVFVLPQNSAVLEHFHTFSQKPQFEDKTFIIALNNFSSVVGPSPKLIKKHRLPAKQVYRINRNPQIQEYMNDGKTLDLVFRLLDRDAMVADVHMNLTKLCNILKYHNADIEGL
jgi:cellulose biosynthesis protein BcsQ